MDMGCIEFEGGEEIPVTLFWEDAPETCTRIVDRLPMGGECKHSRWSGREVNVCLSIDTDIPQENQTVQVNCGDVIYWRDWVMDHDDPTEVIAIYYGPEMTRGPQGPLRVNLFGRIPQEHWSTLTEAGKRIWLGETESIRVYQPDSQ